jgi:prophage antirepressor-like protein
VLYHLKILYLILYFHKILGEILGVNESFTLKKNEKYKKTLNEIQGGSKTDPPLNQNEKNTIYISESGLYELIFSSKKESAIAFKDYVFDTILPSIRKTGSYNIKLNTIYDTSFFTYFLTTMTLQIMIKKCCILCSCTTIQLQIMDHDKSLFNYSDKQFSFIEVNGLVYFRAKNITKFLEYVDIKQAISKNVNIEDKISLKDLGGCLRDAPKKFRGCLRDAPKSQ